MTNVSERQSTGDAGGSRRLRPRLVCSARAAAGGRGRGPRRRRRGSGLAVSFGAQASSGFSYYSARSTIVSGSRPKRTASTSCSWCSTPVAPTSSRRTASRRQPRRPSRRSPAIPMQPCSGATTPTRLGPSLRREPVHRHVRARAWHVQVVAREQDGGTVIAFPTRCSRTRSRRWRSCSPRRGTTRSATTGRHLDQQFGFAQGFDEYSPLGGGRRPGRGQPTHSSRDRR